MNKLIENNPWFGNFYRLYEDTSSKKEQLESLILFSLGLNRWLDTNNVKDNKDNIWLAQKSLKLLRKFAHWEELKEPFESLEPIVKANKRLLGLLK